MEMQCARPKKDMQLFCLIFTCACAINTICRPTFKVPKTRLQVKAKEQQNTVTPSQTRDCAQNQQSIQFVAKSVKKDKRKNTCATTKNEFRLDPVREGVVAIALQKKESTRHMTFVDPKIDLSTLEQYQRMLYKYTNTKSEQKHDIELICNKQHTKCNISNFLLSDANVVDRNTKRVVQEVATKYDFTVTDNAKASCLCFTNVLHAENVSSLVDCSAYKVQAEAKAIQAYFDKEKKKIREKLLQKDVKGNKQDILSIYNRICLFFDLFAIISRYNLYLEYFGDAKIEIPEKVMEYIQAFLRIISHIDSKEFNSKLYCVRLYNGTTTSKTTMLQLNKRS